MRRESDRADTRRDGNRAPSYRTGRRRGADRAGHRKGFCQLFTYSYSHWQGAALTMMKQDEMLKAFARQRKDEIVVPVYTAAQEITHINPNDLNSTFVG